jgi:hypothetical protein
MTEALRSSETSVFPRATRRNISEDGIVLYICASLTEGLPPAYGSGHSLREVKLCMVRDVTALMAGV